MEIVAQKELKGMMQASRSRLGMITFKVVDEDNKENVLKITGDSLKAQLNKYNFDVIDMKAKEKTEPNY